MSAVLSDDASLVRYDAMCTAIAECHQVDEVKDIRDKSRALEIYAQQLNNTQAERKASQVRLRAERRYGELLKELARADHARNPQGHNQHEQRSMSDDATQTSSAKNNANNDRTNDRSEYAEALERTGVSRQSASRYQALADIPEDDFEHALSDPQTKPTTAKLIRDARDPQPQINREALHFWGRLDEFERDSPNARQVAALFDELTPRLQSDVRRVLPKIADYYTQLAEIIANEYP